MNNMNIIELAQKAKEASYKLAGISLETRNKALKNIYEALIENKDNILKANKKDIELSKDVLSEPMLKRLKVDEKVFNYMLKRFQDTILLPDPLGIITLHQINPQGMEVYRKSVPLGVIAMIYEARPNVSTDAVSVCIKSGNALILRGGKEAFNTNICLVDIMKKAALNAGMPEGSLDIVGDTDHETVTEMLKLNDLIDVIIPRGGKGLIKKISEESKIPVIKHYDGICHQYVSTCDYDMAVDVILNSKLQKVEVCNALETLLIDEKIYKDFGPLICQALTDKGVKLLGCEKMREIYPMEKATEEDYYTEYLSYILSIKVVDGVRGAIDHINKYGSHHTDGIITSDQEQIEMFLNEVDSASVLVNASTRLSGGGEYGMGSVVGISTDKLHARGPVGPMELTSYKWIAIGKGNIRK